MAAMSKRAIDIPATLVLVAHLILAPSLIRAQQHLDYRPVSPAASFSRSGEPPPPKTTIDRPAQIIACAAFLTLPAPAASAPREPLEEAPPLRVPLDVCPDPQRGPPVPFSR